MLIIDVSRANNVSKFIYTCKFSYVTEFCSHVSPFPLTPTLHTLSAPHTPPLTRYHLLLCHPLSPTLCTQSMPYHPSFNPLPSTPMYPPFPPSALSPCLITPPLTRYHLLLCIPLFHSRPLQSIHASLPLL